MSVNDFLGLEATDSSLRWRLPVRPALATTGNFLFGGCGLGAAIGALESATERPVVWATAQYLSYAVVGELVELHVHAPVVGRKVTQARVVGSVGDREIFTVNAALGCRDVPLDEQWVTPPEVPGPEESDLRPLRVPGQESINSHLELRLANARPWTELTGNPIPGARSALWARLATGGPLEAATLAIMGDYVPFGIGQAIGALAGGNSLDNTLRIRKLVPTEWVLLDIQVDGIANGFGQGTVRLFAEDGTLLGTASQSTMIRYWGHEHLPAPKLAEETT